MPDLTISELKRALHQVNRICSANYECYSNCPFFDTRRLVCKLKGSPNVWFVDGWKKSKEDSDEKDV